MLSLMYVCILFQPKVVSDTDEMELARQLEKLEEANREISGDDDQDSYSDGSDKDDDDGKTDD